MTSVSSLEAAASDGSHVAAPGQRPTLQDYLELSKARLTALVVVAAGFGYLIPAREIRWGDLLATLVGTALASAAASTLNQLWEVRSDAAMNRTRRRPLPAGRLGPAASLTFAGMTLAGALALLIPVHPLAALLALGSLLIYVGIYTPLKRRTSLNTIVGAVPGALPPMIGWAAATGALDMRAAALFAILFLWQIPHFLAIAWLHRADYARGGFQMLPVVDPSGVSTARMIVIYQLALLGISLFPTLLGMAGPLYFLVAFALGLGFLATGVSTLRRIDQGTARRVFLASLLYLPILLGSMVLDPVEVITEPTPFTITDELPPGLEAMRTGDPKSPR